MARGWESKSVESQQEEAGQTQVPDRARLTPEQQLLQRQKEGLMLSRKHILEQLNATQNPRYQELLRNSLAELDARLAVLG